jgi:hypothetical protein
MPPTPIVGLQSLSESVVRVGQSIIGIELERLVVVGDGAS